MAGGTRIRNVVPKAVEIRPAEVRRALWRTGLPSSLHLRGGERGEAISLSSAVDIRQRRISTWLKMGEIPDLQAEMVSRYTSVLEGTRSRSVNRSGQIGRSVLRGLWRVASVVLRPFDNIAKAWASGTMFSIIGGIGGSGKSDTGVKEKDVSAGDLSKEAQGTIVEAENLLAVEEYDKAQDKFDLAVKIYVAMGEIDAAGKALEIAGEAFATEARHYWGEGFDSLSAGDFSGAKEYWATASELFEIGHSFYDRSVRTYITARLAKAAGQKRKRIKNRVGVAKKLSRAGGPQAVRQIVRRSRSRGDSHQAYWDRVRAIRNWIREGKYFANMCDFEQAADVFLRAAEGAAAMERYALASDLHVKRGDALSEYSVRVENTVPLEEAADSYRLAIEMMDKVAAGEGKTSRPFGKDSTVVVQRLEKGAGSGREFLIQRKAIIYEQWAKALLAAGKKEKARSVIAEAKKLPLNKTRLGEFEKIEALVRE